MNSMRKNCWFESMVPTILYGKQTWKLQRPSPFEVADITTNLTIFCQRVRNGSTSIISHIARKPTIEPTLMGN